MVHSVEWDRSDIPEVEGLMPNDEKAIMERLFSQGAQGIQYHPDTPVRPLVRTLSFAGHPTLHRGELAAISGAPGAGKTSLVTSAMATCLVGADRLAKPSMAIHWECHNPGDGPVVYFDCEQVEGILNWRLTQIRRMTGGSYPSFFSLKEVTAPENRVRFLAKVVMDLANAHGGKLHSIWIDGITDLLTSVNDESQSKEMVELLSSVAALSSTPIVGVVHVNKGFKAGGTMRGHIGAEYERKAATALQTVSCDKKDHREIRSIKARHSAEIEKTYMCWDEGERMLVGVEGDFVTARQEQGAAEWDRIAKAFQRAQKADELIPDSPVHNFTLPRSRLNAIYVEFHGYQEGNSASTRVGKDVGLLIDRGLLKKVPSEGREQEYQLTQDGKNRILASE
jgi:replicative DNA helicase